MVIATFGPSTGWAAKTISYEDGRFTLEGHGAVSAADVLTYDAQGHISWAYEGLREWVGQLAATLPPALPASGRWARAAPCSSPPTAAPRGAR